MAAAIVAGIIVTIIVGALLALLEKPTGLDIIGWCQSHQGQEVGIIVLCVVIIICVIGFVGLVIGSIFFG